jgi:hypothetical protein
MRRRLDPPLGPYIKHDTERFTKFYEEPEVMLPPDYTAMLDLTPMRVLIDKRIASELSRLIDEMFKDAITTGSGSFVKAPSLGKSTRGNFFPKNGIINTDCVN